MPKREASLPEPGNKESLFRAKFRIAEKPWHFNRLVRRNENVTKASHKFNKKSVQMFMTNKQLYGETPTSLDVQRPGRIDFRLSLIHNV